MIAALEHWRPPSSWARITTIDAHTGGEPLRIIVSGVPPIPGTTILERRRYVREHLDRVRTALMYEPRGHREMYGCLVTPPVSPSAHFGVLFMHNEGYSTMCGHGIIAMAMVAVETGLVPVGEGDTEVRIDAPAGLVVARVLATPGGPRRRVAFRNVPSFTLALGEWVEVPGLGRVQYDLAFGGAFYAFVDATRLGLRCTKDEHDRLIAVGMAIKHAVMASRPIAHPDERDLGFLYGTILIAPSEHGGVHSRNVCVFADGQVDRSPTGTGVSARMAIHHARGEVGRGEPLVIESIVGSRFTGTVLETTRVGPHAAVIPQVEGEAWITGRHEFLVEPGDPLAGGVFLG
jgi:trans-L-3-hydroxyproline dehydratase